MERDFRESLFEQQQARQVDSTKAIAQHIGSDLRAISTELKLVASDESIRSGNLDGPQAAAVLEKTFLELTTHNSLQSPASGESEPIIDGIYLVDTDGIVTLDFRAEGRMSIVGMNISSRQYVTDTRESTLNQFSGGYIGMDGVLRIAATQPIMNDAGEYVGLVATTMPTAPFFQHYGNIHDIGSQYLAVLDTSSTQLVHPVPAFVGTPFFGEITQNATGRNEVLNNQISRVMAGEPSSSMYEFANGERFNTGHPIFFDGKPVYFVFVVTPTSAVYSSIDDILSAQRLETFTVLSGTTVSIGALIFLLTRWNSGLNKEVSARTKELRDSNSRLMKLNSQLEESNRQLAIANDKMISINRQLERNERVQKDFINVAAHELRTPIQPILGLTEVMHGKTTDPEMLEIIGTIERSAKRLLHLSSDILDAARIEGQGITMSRESFELNSVLLRSVQEHLAEFHRKNIRLNFEPGAKAMVFADKTRIGQVVSNLLSNAAKFTERGTVTLSAEREGGDVIVSVTDSGSGIHADIVPRLFTKFATKSEKGTGLGLFISKNIIESHGGRIWGQNNPSGQGATFGFSLPVSEGVAGVDKLLGVPEEMRVAQAEN